MIERCSGHGGTFGVVKATHDVAVKVGRPVFRTRRSKARGHIVSDCPLAAQHIVAERQASWRPRMASEAPVREPEHPIEIMARALWIAGELRCPRISSARSPPADILSDAEYAAQRDAPRKAVIAGKKNRRVEVGPFATFYFENYDTMWLQVHGDAAHRKRRRRADGRRAGSL